MAAVSELTVCHGVLFYDLVKFLPPLCATDETGMNLRVLLVVWESAWEAEA